MSTELMNGEKTNPETTIQQQLQDPRVAESLARILQKLPQLEKGINLLAEASESAEGLVATGIDTFDEECQRINETGFSLDERMEGLYTLFLKLTNPGTLQALERLIHCLPLLDKLSQAVIKTQANESARSGRVGMIGLLQALGDRNVQHSLSFGVHVAQSFGAEIASQDSQGDK